MHELSIAHELVTLACDAAERAGSPPIRAVHVRVGALAGVAGDALALGYEAAAAGTPLAGAMLVVEWTPAEAHCTECGRNIELAGFEARACPVCGSPAIQLVRGHELELAALEADAP